MGKGVDIRRRGEGGYAQGAPFRSAAFPPCGGRKGAQCSPPRRAKPRCASASAVFSGSLPSRLKDQHPDLLRGVPRGIDRNAVHSAQLQRRPARSARARGARYAPVFPARSAVRPPDPRCRAYCAYRPPAGPAGSPAWSARATRCPCRRRGAVRHRARTAEVQSPAGRKAPCIQHGDKEPRRACQLERQDARGLRGVPSGELPPRGRARSDLLDRQNEAEHIGDVACRRRRQAPARCCFFKGAQQRRGQRAAKR